MRGFLAFAITFGMLFHIWLLQYKFFRRYGLNDNFVIWITGALLFVVLFYVYPLKFVWTLIVNALLGFGTTVQTANGAVEPVVRDGQMPTMLAIYGIGFAAVFAIFALLYLHAYRKRAALELNELETYDTRIWAQENALMVAVGALSVCIALFGGSRHTLLSGMTYWFIAPILFAHGTMMGRRRRRIEERVAADGIRLNASTH